MLDRNAIYTDGQGRPFDRPERPAWMDDPDVTPPLTRAQIDEGIAYDRAWYEYEDRVLACGTAAFEKQFRKSLRE